MFTSYTKDVKSTLELRHLENGSLVLEFPLEIGSISSTSGKREDEQFFFKLSTFTSPGITYRVDLSNGNYTPVVSANTIKNHYTMDYMGITKVA